MEAYYTYDFNPYIKSESPVEILFLGDISGIALPLGVVLKYENCEQILYWDTKIENIIFMSCAFSWYKNVLTQWTAEAMFQIKAESEAQRWLK